MNTQPIRFACTHCGTRIKAPAPLGGRKKNCPLCKKSVTVPKPIGDTVEKSRLVLEESKDFLALRVKPKEPKNESDTQIIRKSKLGSPTKSEG